MITNSTLRANARRVFLFNLLLFCLILNGNAQIYFQNPMMEGIPQADVPPPNWKTCSWTPDTHPVNSWFLPAYEGATYLGLQFAGDDFNGFYDSEKVSQKLSCNLKKGYSHEFNLYAYNLFSFQYVFTDSGVLKIFGAINECGLDTLLWQSPILDSVWHSYTVEFIPNKCYLYLTFAVENLGYLPLPAINLHCFIGIDALSEISVDGYNFFNFPNADTTINKGACVSFAANSDDTTAIFYWSTTAGDSVATGDSINVCPASTTTYVCTATLGCGQQFIDSVTVTVIGGGSSGTPILKIPNLLSADNPTWQIVNATSAMQVTIYNTLGQLVYKNKEYNNTLNITKLAAATYFYEVKYGSNTYRGKLMVVR